jgi:hypothetical protein
MDVRPERNYTTPSDSLPRASLGRRHQPLTENDKEMAQARARQHVQKMLSTIERKTRGRISAEFSAIDARDSQGFTDGRLNGERDVQSKTSPLRQSVRSSLVSRLAAAKSFQKQQRVRRLSHTSTGSQSSRRSDVPSPICRSEASARKSLEFFESTTSDSHGHVGDLAELETIATYALDESHALSPSLGMAPGQWLQKKSEPNIGWTSHPGPQHVERHGVATHNFAAAGAREAQRRGPPSSGATAFEDKLTVLIASTGDARHQVSLTTPADSVELADLSEALRRPSLRAEGRDDTIRSRHAVDTSSRSGSQVSAERADERGTLAALVAEDWCSDSGDATAVQTVLSEWPELPDKDLIHARAREHVQQMLISIEQKTRERLSPKKADRSPVRTPGSAQKTSSCRQGERSPLPVISAQGELITPPRRRPSAAEMAGVDPLIVQRAMVEVHSMLDSIVESRSPTSQSRDQSPQCKSGLVR